MIVLKSERELKYLRDAGRIVAETRLELEKAIRPGITTKELDSIAEDYIVKRGGVPAFKGYQGFPASICTSINDQVVHGIPSMRKLVPGDILSIDVGVSLKGYYGDAAFTVPVGEVPGETMRLLRVTEEALYRGIEQARPGNRLHDISSAIESHVAKAGFSVVREYVGHGIGRQMHEDPQVPNFGVPGTGPALREGMTLAIEPMVNMGSHEVVVDDDSWTVRTKDGSLSAHFEHTIAIRSTGPEILTCI